MDIFGKAARKQHERLTALVVTVCENNPNSGPESAAAYDAAVAALRNEGEAAENFMLSVASQGVPASYVVTLWSAIYEVCGDAVAPAVVHVLRTGVSQARTQAAMMLSALAETSPGLRDDCLAALRGAAAQDEDEELRRLAAVLADGVERLAHGGEGGIRTPEPGEPD